MKNLLIAVLLFIICFLLIDKLSIKKVEAIDKSELQMLFEVSENKINDMVSTNVWSHTNSDGSTFLQRVNNLRGYKGENLYEGPCDIKNAMKLWEQSETHNYVLNHEADYSILLMAPKSDGSGCYMTYHNMNISD